jgi:glycosyltransferase involved in cell wall biosynthesis
VTGPKLAFAWHGLPFYAVRLLAHLSRAIDQDFQILGSDGPLSRETVQDILGRELIWVDPMQSLEWHELGLDVPDLLVHTGWAYRGFNTLASAVKRHGGSVISMVDNSRKHNARQLIGSVIFRTMYRSRIDAVWVPGQSGFELMRFFGLPPQRIYTGLYGADPSIFRPVTPICSRPKLITFVGQLIPRKAPDLLTRAFTRFREIFPDWRLLLIGNGPLSDHIRSDAVEVLPFIAADAVAERLRQSRFFVLPSLEEHWGVVVHEAALSGCALLLSDGVGAAPDLLTTGNGYSFPAGDEGALFDALCAAGSTTDAALVSMSRESIKLAARFGPDHFVHSFTCIGRDLGFSWNSSKDRFTAAASE